MNILDGIKYILKGRDSIRFEHAGRDKVRFEHTGTDNEYIGIDRISFEQL